MESVAITSTCKAARAVSQLVSQAAAHPGAARAVRGRG
jgi:hypothetical protein